MDERLAGEKMPARLELEGTVSSAQGVFSMCVSDDVGKARLAVCEGERNRHRDLLSRGFEFDETSDFESRVGLGVRWADHGRPGEEPG